MNSAVLEQKKQIVDEITKKFDESSAAVVCEYRGLTVAEVTELRRLLRAENVELVVYKNSMVQRAADAKGYEGLAESLKGPNAFAFSADAVAPSRVLAKFAKKHDKLILKSGVVEGKVVGEATLKELASLPNKEGMISMLLGCLQSPVRSVACAVKAVADAKAENE